MLRVEFIVCACVIQDLDTKFRDKETVMRNSAERRIRGYLRLVCILSQSSCRPAYRES